MRPPLLKNSDQVITESFKIRDAAGNYKTGVTYEDVFIFWKVEGSGDWNIISLSPAYESMMFAGGFVEDVAGNGLYHVGLQPQLFGDSRKLLLRWSGTDIQPDELLIPIWGLDTQQSLLSQMGSLATVVNVSTFSPTRSRFAVDIPFDEGAENSLAGRIVLFKVAEPPLQGVVASIKASGDDGDGRTLLLVEKYGGGPLSAAPIGDEIIIIP